MRAIASRTRGFTAFNLFTVVAVPLFTLYLVTASWSLPYNIDAVTNVLTAWELGTDGDVFLEDQAVLATDDYIGNIAWVVPAGESVAAQYPPGTAALAAPLYAVWPEEASLRSVFGVNIEAPPVDILVPPIAPAAIVAAVVVAIAMGLLALSFRRLVDDRLAVLAAYTLGLATGAWSVAADSLWQHGPGMLWIAAGTLLSIQHKTAAGVAFGAAILTRPHLALVAAANGVWQSWCERSFRPMVLIGFGSAAGLAALVWFNNAVFGSPSITGGYGGSFVERAASADILDYLGNVLLALVHLERGLLIYSPFLILLIPGLRVGWEAAPVWVRGSAVGGLLYLLLQLKANRYSGGSGFWGYRYPLETLAAAAPLLLLSYTEWLRHRSVLLQKVFRWLITVSIGLTALGAVAF